MKTIQKVVLLAAGIATGVALSTAPAIAHHSTSAFDETQVIKIDGTVTQFRWINPHASFKLEGVAEGDAPDGLWTVEMTAANILVSQGWKRTSIKAGDRVVAYIRPLRNPITLKDGSQGGLYVGIELADGTRLGPIDGPGAGTDE